MSKGDSIVKWMKGQSISWIGHLERMKEDRMPKKIFTRELEGTRRRGRPRKRWKEEVERDIQVLGVRRWRELEADRKKWKDIVRQAKAHSGLYCQWKKKNKEEKKKKKKKKEEEEEEKDVTIARKMEHIKIIRIINW